MDIDRFFVLKYPEEYILKAGENHLLQYNELSSEVLKAFPKESVEIDASQSDTAIWAGIQEFLVQQAM